MPKLLPALQFLFFLLWMGLRLRRHKLLAHLLQLSQENQKTNRSLRLSLCGPSHRLFALLIVPKLPAQLHDLLGKIADLKRIIDVLIWMCFPIVVHYIKHALCKMSQSGIRMMALVLASVAKRTRVFYGKVCAFIDGLRKLFNPAVHTTSDSCSVCGDARQLARKPTFGSYPSHARPIVRQMFSKRNGVPIK